MSKSTMSIGYINIPSPLIRCSKHFFTSSSPSIQKITKIFADISERLERLTRHHQERHSSPLDESNFERQFDELKDEMRDFCIQLTHTRATTLDHLRLKASAILHLLPEEADPSVLLARSICEDILSDRSDLYMCGSTRSSV